MENSKTEKYVNELVSHIFSYFKPLGYKKKGNNFRYYNKEEKWGKMINFQKSQWNTKLHITNEKVYFFSMYVSFRIKCICKRFLLSYD